MKKRWFSSELISYVFGLKMKRHKRITPKDLMKKTKSEE